LKQTANPWNYKPWWCQPWSIILTGVVAIVISWLLLQKIWITVLVALPIMLWWFYFLLLWPKLIVESGIIDDASNNSTSASTPTPANDSQNPFIKES
jgi:hypothetical protein